MYLIRKIIVISIISLTSSITIANPRLRPDNWAHKIIESKLENFYMVSPKLYRSEQPNDVTFKEIESIGIKSILNLRNFHADTREAKDSSLILYRVKMNAGSITEEHIYKSLKIIKESNGPILIHCWHGSDRTGTIAAAYRMVFQNWTKKDAIDEFRNGNFGYHEKYYPNLISLLEKLDVKNMQLKLQK